MNVPQTHRFAARAFIAVAMIAACRQPPQETPATNAGQEAVVIYEPFPAGYGYLTDTTALRSAVESGDLAAVRRHGWLLWAGVMQPAASLPEWPVWGTWQNSFSAFQNDTSGVCKDGSEPLLTTRRTGTRNMLVANAIIRSATSFDLPHYPVPDAVIAAYPCGICRTDTGELANSTTPHDSTTVCDGPTFVNNGDIMIPTESLTREGFDWIRGDRLFLKSKLDALHAAGTRELDGPATQIVTKHMYWPVLADGLSAIPVWRDDFLPEFEGYAGYEMWDTLVAVDPSRTLIGTTQEVSYLHGVFTDATKTQKLGAIVREALVYGLDNFYHHEVTTEDWARFTDADKAIINAASYWAYDKPFGVGDYLVTVAMHINTKEVPSWAAQSVWWSDRADQGPFSRDRPGENVMPARTQGPWSNYLMTTSYDMPRDSVEFPVSMNPYIELAVHPVRTNCQQCHSQAGWPRDSNGDKEWITKADFQWIIPDRAR